MGQLLFRKYGVAFLHKHKCMMTAVAQTSVHSFQAPLMPNIIHSQEDLLSLPLLIDPQVCLLATHFIGSIEDPVRDIRKDLHKKPPCILKMHHRVIVACT